MFSTPPPQIKFNSIQESEIIELKFKDIRFKAYQIVYGYDVKRAEWVGLITTNMSVKDLNKKAGTWTAELYIKARNHKGLWELKLLVVLHHRL